jgi:hypothetical protein
MPAIRFPQLLIQEKPKENRIKNRKAAKKNDDAATQIK